MSKRFRSRADGNLSLTSFLWRGLRGNPHQEKWALRDVNFEIQPGERVAVLGPNGAGKTTLLRLIADTLVPTEGTVRVNGSVAPVAGILGGFEGRLSGKDNLVLRAAMFGLSLPAIHELIPQVVEFAELEEAIDLPVETYSTGMQARLGFSLSIHLQADIHLIDEGMSAGDATFRKKAKKAMAERISSGGTWVIVTHDREHVKEFCQRGMLFERGRMVASGDLDDLTS